MEAGSFRIFSVPVDSVVAMAEDASVAEVVLAVAGAVNDRV